MGVSLKTLPAEGEVSERPEANYRTASQNTEASAADRGSWLQTSLAHLLLGLSIALFFRGQLGPALIVLLVYIGTLIFILPGGAFYVNDEH